MIPAINVSFIILQNFQKLFSRLLWVTVSIGVKQIFKILISQSIYQKWAWMRMSLSLIGIWTWNKNFSVLNENKTECINPQQNMHSVYSSCYKYQSKLISPSDCPGNEFLRQFLQKILKTSNVQHSALAGFTLEVMEIFSKENRKWLVISITSKKKTLNLENTRFSLFIIM